MDLLELLGDVGQAALSPMVQARYGVSPNQKADMEFYGIEGGPNNAGVRGTAQGNPTAEREVSSFLGGQMWGAGPAKAFNEIALGDLADNWGSILSGGGLDPAAYMRNMAGHAAAERGASMGATMPGGLSVNDLMAAIQAAR